MLYATANRPLEFSFTSGKRYDDAFNEVTVDVVFSDPDGCEMRVPAFWAGESTWSVRFSSAVCGGHKFRTEASDTSNVEIHGRTGEIEVAPYEGSNPLFVRGGLRPSADERHLEYADGTPFFWLADTWWMGLCKRLAWPGDFKEITADRTAKGFNVIQIVAGLYPDMPAFDPLGANEAAQAWEPDYARIYPPYFDMADLRIEWLVRSGLAPCIVGAWGYHLGWLGIEKMKRHWRYLVARWGAYPVVWCLAGEATMPGYLAAASEKDQLRDSQRKGWTELARYVREIDGYGRAATIHPTVYGREQVEDDSVLDFEMLQTGHGGYESIADTARCARSAVRREPRMPVINSEVSYEGIMEGSRQEIQRIMFWISLLSGTCGHTYGANGIWQFSSEEHPYPPSPHGASWGKATWREAMDLPGSTHVGVGKSILEGFEWWRFEPHQEWITPAADDADFMLPYAAGIPGEVRLFYFPRAIAPWGMKFTVRSLETSVAWKAVFIDPKDASEEDVGPIEPDSSGSWGVPQPSVMQDWVLALVSDG